MGGNKNNIGKVSLFLPKTHVVIPHQNHLSHRDSSNEGLRHVFVEK